MQCLLVVGMTPLLAALLNHVGQAVVDLDGLVLVEPW